ncbi:MAG: class A beta-lactamase-related serine hydrolase [Saprospiraceae bacterium]|nr:class A beta-lactamase-related serine hydrolase [Saprospiraceae bacterium]
MKKLFVCVSFLWMLSSSCYAQKGTSIPGGAALDTTQLTSKINAYVRQYTDLDIFSGVVMVALDGKPQYHTGFGLANRELKKPVTTKTRFHIGSMNKSFTLVVVLQLIHEKKLKISDPLVSWVDGFQQADAHMITIEHLLNHQSGFGDYHSPRFFDLPDEKKTIQGITEILQTAPLFFKPGTSMEYSNAGYVLLGAVIEKATGKSYSQNVEERIIQPLQLNQTYTKNVNSIPEKSVGYIRTINGFRDNLNFMLEPKSDGGFWSTSSDIFTFYRNFFYGEKLLSAEMRAPMAVFQKLNQTPVKKAMGIAGGMNGSNSVFLELPNEKISIVVLANMDEPVAEKIAKGIQNIILSQPVEPASLPAVLNVYKAYKDHNIDYLKNNFEALTSGFRQGEPKDFILNDLGYQLMSFKQYKEALEILKLNTELFPEIANCWDSFGEALLMNDMRSEALTAYKKARCIRPNLPSALEAVKNLEGN